MMKLVFIWEIVLSLVTNARADDITFLHPIFYQQLSSQNDDYFYVLKPNTIFYENSETGEVISEKCILQENQEKFIKLLCGNCYNLEYTICMKHIHTFSLSKNRMTDNNYIISHNIYDENNNLKSEEILTNDGLITIPPYQ